MEAWIKRQIKRKPVFWGAWALYCLFYLAIAVQPLEKTTKTAVLDLIYLFPPALAVLGTAYAFIKVGQAEKRFWLYLAAASLLMFTGEIFWSYYEVFQGLDQPPYPSPADYSYLMGYLFFFPALLFMAKFSKAVMLTRVRHLLDILVAMVLSSVLLWFFLLKPLHALYPDSAATERLVNLLYPTLDLAIIFGLFANLLGFKVARWRSWEVMIALGLVSTAFGDIIFNYFSAANAYEVSNIWAKVLDLTWATGYFLIFAAAVARLAYREASVRDKSLASSPSRSKWSDIALLVVLLPTMPLLIYLAVAEEEAPFSQGVLVLSATALATLIVLRAAVVMVENDRLFSRSVRDSVTGLFNHRFFQERLGVELDRAQRYDEKLGLALFDLDDFRRVNNVYGHRAGDDALRAIARVLDTFTRSSDTACRIGGDEFALIMPDTGPVEAMKVCLKVQKEINKLKDKGPFMPALSAGIACFPAHSEEKDDMEKKADAALYWAKYNGKDKVVIYDPELTATLNPEERIQRVREESYLSTVEALAATVDARDPYTQSHSKHVAALTVALGRKLGLDPDHLGKLRTAALLHDIGKIGIPDKILNKRGKLDEAERRQIEEHPLISEKIIVAATFEKILPWVIGHHEHWDGNGYPHGLKGADIPLEARMLAICDMFAAMTSNRPYRQSLSTETALEEIERERGRQVDPELSAVFIAMIRKQGGANPDEPKPPALSAGKR